MPASIPEAGRRKDVILRSLIVRYQEEDAMSPGYALRHMSGLLCIVLLTVAYTAYGQVAGTIKGTVYDKTTKDKLPGANVIIKGTSSGASTNLDGFYTIKNAPAGVQTLTVAYVGYKSTNITVTIPTGGTLTQDIMLSPDDHRGGRGPGHGAGPGTVAGDQPAALVRQDRQRRVRGEDPGAAGLQCRGRRSAGCLVCRHCRVRVKQARW